MAYSFSRTLTIDHTKVGSTDQTNFTVLFGGAAGPYTYLRTVANGGKVQNTVSFNGQTVPADLKFTSDSGGATLLSWEVASYTATTGAIEVWVKIGTVSHTTDTVIYMWYGDSSVTTYQGGSVGAAWDANYKAVYHLPDGSTLALKDSTSNGFDLTGTNTPTAATGQIDGGIGVVNASAQYASRSSTDAMSAAMTLEAWFKPSSFPNAYGTIIATDAVSSVYFDLHVKSSGKLAIYVHTTTGDSFYDGTGSTTLSTGTWYHLVATYDSTNGLKGYLNGSVDGSGSALGTIAGPGTVVQLSNNTPNFAGRYVDGVIDEARISSVARSADWITAEYNNQNSPSTFYTVGAESSPSPFFGGPFPNPPIGPTSIISY